MYDLTTFKWLGYSETSPQEISRSQTALARRGALDTDGDITKEAVALERVEAATVDLSLCMTESDRYGCALEVATFLAFTNQPRGPFGRTELGALAYQRFRRGCHDDLELYLRVFHHWSIQGTLSKKRAWAK